MDLSDFTDPYLDPESGILRNLVGARTRDALSDAGWQLDWQHVQGSTNDHACRVAAEQRDFGPLREMFDGIVSPAVPVLDRDAAWRAAELGRLSVGSGADARPPAPDAAREARSSSRAEHPHRSTPGEDSLGLGPNATRKKPSHGNNADVSASSLAEGPRHDVREPNWKRGR